MKTVVTILLIWTAIAAVAGLVVGTGIRRLDHARAVPVRPGARPRRATP